MSQPIAVWAQFFTDAMVDSIVAETARYARGSGNVAFSVSERDIRAWIGLVYAMGVHKLPSVRHYWSDKWLFRVGHFRVMTRNRFETIKRYFHINNNAENADDKLRKIRPLLEMLETQSVRNFIPSRELSLDEMMVRFTGRVGFKFVKQKKPTSDGLKVYSICDAKTGYTIHSRVDLRDGTTVREVVLDLVARLPQKRHLVVMDNYFTSVATFDAMLEMDQYGLGTMRANRGQPRGWGVTDKTAAGTSMWQVRGEKMAVMSWKDTGPVTLLSTAHNPEEATAIRRRTKTAPYFVDRPAPKAAEDYNNFIGGVDLADQLRSYYSCQLISRKWWHALLFWVLDVCMINAWIWHRTAYPQDAMSHLDFIESVCMALIGGRLGDAPDGDEGLDFAAARPAKRRRVEDVDSLPSGRLVGVHTPQWGDGPHRCPVCHATSKKESRIKTKCRECDRYMCLGECWATWHSGKMEDVVNHRG